MKYWNLNEILPYQRNFNFINGKRRCGKSYTLIKWVIKRCIEREEEFCLLVRTAKEIEDNALEDWVQKVIQEQYSDFTFKFSKNAMYHEIVHQIPTGVDKEGNQKYKTEPELIRIGIALALSQRTQIKKKSFPKVKYMILEEYMIEDDKKGEYVNGWGEPDLFLSIYDTIDRGEDRVICFLLGNCTTFYNPYHMHETFNIPKVKKGEIWYKGNVLFQWIDENKVTGKSGSKFDKMIEGSKYGRFAVNNEYSDDRDDFIMPRTQQATFRFAIDYIGSTYGVWCDTKVGVIFIDTKWDTGTKFRYALTLEDHRENTLMTKGKTAFFIKWLGDNFKRGNVRYVNKAVRAKAEGAIKLIL